MGKTEFKAGTKARARARASNGLMCVKEGRPNVMPSSRALCDIAN